MLDGLTLDQLRVFVAIAENGSFRSAAKGLGRAQSAVSGAIANLEAQLDLALFDRTEHKPRLTAEGEALLSDAKALLIKVGAMRAKAVSIRKGTELRLRIAVDPLFPPDLVAMALRDFRSQFPGTAIELTTAPLGSALAAVLDGGCDFALTTSDASTPEVEVEALSGLPNFIAVCGPEHPLSRYEGERAGWSAVEFADHVQIVVTDPSERTEGQSFGIISPSIWRVDHITMKHALIRASIGWGNLPEWMVRDDIVRKRLVRVPSLQAGTGGDSPIVGYLISRIDRPLGPAGKFIRERLTRGTAF